MQPQQSIHNVAPTQKAHYMYYATNTIGIHLSICDTIRVIAYVIITKKRLYNVNVFAEKQLFPKIRYMGLPRSIRCSSYFMIVCPVVLSALHCITKDIFLYDSILHI